MIQTFYAPLSARNRVVIALVVREVLATARV